MRDLAARPALLNTAFPLAPPHPVARHIIHVGPIHDRMNDFHIALLWLHSLESLVGHPSILMLSEIELDDLFVRYRSPYKA
jgi:hypothetical protein